MRCFDIANAHLPPVLPQSQNMKKTASIQYLEFGEGPALVILPSPLIMATTYRNLAIDLSRFFKVYVPELPGRGLSRSTHKVLDVGELTERYFPAKQFTSLPEVACAPSFKRLKPNLDFVIGVQWHPSRLSTELTEAFHVNSQKGRIQI